MMEPAFLSFVLFSSLAAFSSQFDTTDWEDVMVALEGERTTLVCTDTTVSGPIAINWMVKSSGADEWKLVLSASEGNEFSGSGSKASMQLVDHNFQDTGVFSMDLSPKTDDSGLYSCLIKQRERKLKERIILLAVLSVTVAPPAPVPQLSTLRLVASVRPDSAVSLITWEAPGGIPMRSQRIPRVGTVAKLPQIQSSDGGPYVCTVHPWGDGHANATFSFSVDVPVADKVVSFTNITHDPLVLLNPFRPGPTISTATQAQTTFTLPCPEVRGDLVRLYWVAPDSRKHEGIRLYRYDRWRDTTWVNNKRKGGLALAGPPYNAEAGSFSFRLAPGLREGGVYICEVFLNDVAFSQRVQLSVLKVKASRSASKMELTCLYSERSQVQSAKWRYNDKGLQLKQSSKSPGVISTVLPVPITPDTAGNYTCTLVLKNGQTIWATHVVTMPREESVTVAPASWLLPPLSALLLLVPLVAAAVGVLLWRQKHISGRGIEQSLSAHSGETENIYEYPEDIRQAHPEGSVYMDLKPRGDDDVYKELERCEQCQS